MFKLINGFVAFLNSLRLSPIESMIEEYPDHTTPKPKCTIKMNERGGWSIYMCQDKVEWGNYDSYESARRYAEDFNFFTIVEE